MEEKKNVVFRTLMKYLDEEQKTLMNDFLKIYYYFIVCYSKNCYKKYARWQSKYNKKYIFVYSTLDNSMAQKQILEIQTKIINYRKEYKQTDEKQYFNQDKIKEILTFAKNSINLCCTDIREPVKFISTEINALLQFYKQKIDNEKEENHQDKKQKKSQKLNYAVLEELGITV